MSEVALPETNAIENIEAEDDVAGYATNMIYLSPGTVRMLNQLQGLVNSLTRPIDWNKAFEGATVYYPNK